MKRVRKRYGKNNVISYRTVLDKKYRTVISYRTFTLKNTIPYRNSVPYRTVLPPLLSTGALYFVYEFLDEQEQSSFVPFLSYRPHQWNNESFLRNPLYPPKQPDLRQYTSFLVLAMYYECLINFHDDVRSTNAVLVCKPEVGHLATERPPVH